MWSTSKALPRVSFRLGRIYHDGVVRRYLWSNRIRGFPRKQMQMLDGNPPYWALAIGALGLATASGHKETAMCCQAAPDPLFLNRAGLANYELGNLIGKGMFSEVREGVHTLTGTKVAVKIINNLGTDSATISTEIRAMKLAKGHPHVVSLFEVFQDADYTYLVMEYCPGGTLDEYLMAYGKVSESRARLWTHQLVDAVTHCHANRVVHMDVKPANIYLDAKGNIKLGDFGLAVVTIDAYTEELHQAAGSPVYAAPEVYRASFGSPRSSFVGPVAAVWAIGTVLHTMLTRALPFEVSTYPDACPPYSPPEGLTLACTDLLTALMSPDPSVRLDESEILLHPWMTQHGAAACCCESLCNIPATLASTRSVLDDRISLDSAGSNTAASCMAGTPFGRESSESSCDTPLSPPVSPFKFPRRSRSRGSGSGHHHHFTCEKNWQMRAETGDDDTRHDNSSLTCLGDDALRERTKERMRELGFIGEAVDAASRSNAVFSDHLAAIFSMLLSAECTAAHPAADECEVKSHV